MALTSIDDLDSAGTTAYELAVYFALRSETVYSSPMVTTVKPTNQTHRGSTVRFWFTDDLATATTPLTEETDVTAGVVADSFVDVAITEYGAATGGTLKQMGTNMLEYDAQVAEVNARQAADSFEVLARTALNGGSNVIYSSTNTARGTIAAGHIATAAKFREAVARLRANSAAPIVDGKYLSIIHPDVSYDLRQETGDAAWVTGRNYSELTGINAGYIGSFGGAIFHESPRAEIVADGGASTVDAYISNMMGREALAMAYSQKVSAAAPQARISPVTDKLSRFHHVGWYWLGGFDSFRQAAHYRIETSSSIGANA